MRVFIFSTIFVWNISHSKKNSARYYRNFANAPKNDRSMWQNLYQTTRRHIQTKAVIFVVADTCSRRLVTVAFRNFANAPKNDRSMWQNLYQTTRRHIQTKTVIFVVVDTCPRRLVTAERSVFAWTAAGRIRVPLRLPSSRTPTV